MSKKLLIAVLMIISPILVFAHPHVFILNTMDIIFDDNGLTGIKLYWKFDAMFSAVLFTDFDLNGDKKFSKSEIDNIKKESLSSIAEYDYFSYITINGKSYKINSVRDFNVTVSNDVITYMFFIPCKVKSSTTINEVIIAVYDESYFIDFFIDENNPIKVKKPSKISHSLKIRNNLKKSYYMGQIAPEEVILTFKEK